MHGLDRVCNAPTAITSLSQKIKNFDSDKGEGVVPGLNFTEGIKGTYPGSA